MTTWADGWSCSPELTLLLRSIDWSLAGIFWALTVIAFFSAWPTIDWALASILDLWRASNIRRSMRNAWRDR